MKSTAYSRRDFLRTGAAASIGLATGSIWVPKIIRAGGNETSRVVIVTDEQSFDGQNIQPDVVRVMVDEGIKALTDASNPSDAWLTIFPDLAPDMGIGIKVNTINHTYLPSHPGVAYPLAESLADTPLGPANFPLNQIVIWDR
ncbi:MAG TPA: twin-arginine translocation signal domain-containing protein, partial [Bacteroidetes bacterium]|nr:twin-arginine translocation signal domain-containing protein [Bacteroidota bacterium]